MLGITPRRIALFPLLIVLAATSFAQRPWTGELPPAAPAPLVFDFSKKSDDVAVLIEFNEPPLLARRDQHEVRAAEESIRTLDALGVQLERDLQTVERGTTRVESQATDTIVRFHYRMTFAGASAHVRRQSLAAIRALPYVKAVHPDRKFEAHLVKSVPRISAPKVWTQFGARGHGVTVAIVDTGVDYQHVALGHGFGPGHKVAGGYDFFNDDADPMDDHGHGTHVAGIVAGDVAPVIGVAPDATLLAYKVLDRDGSGETSTVLAGVERAIDPNNDGNPADHADVVNLSLGTEATANDPVVDAVERGVAAGVVFAISAGNAQRHGSVGSPGIAPSAITVGAMSAVTAAGFTSRGPAIRGWSFKPDVGAPGEFIVSARRGGGTLTASGTSMAAPHIAGVAALIHEVHPSWTPAQVKSAIVSTATPADDLQGESGILAEGSGCVDALRAVQAKILPSPANVSFGIASRFSGFTGTRTIRLTNSGETADTLHATVTNLPPRATAKVTPAEITLAPGASADVTLELTFPSPGPLPNEGQVAVTGRIEFTGTQSSLQVPWIAVNGDILSVTWTGSDDFELGIFATANPAPMYTEDGRTFVSFAPVEANVVVGNGEGATTEPRLIIRELQPVNGFTSITISPDDAPYRLTVGGVDEHGVPFSEMLGEGTGNRSYVVHRFYLPSTGILEMVNAEGVRSMRISPLKKTAVWSWDAILKADESYSTMRILNSIDGDTVMGAEAREWATQTFSYECKTNCRVRLLHGLGSFMFFAKYDVRRGGGTWKLHLTAAPAPDADFRALLNVTEETVPYIPTISPWTFMSPFLRNIGGAVTLAPLGRINPNVDYSESSQEHPLAMGDGPVVLRMSMSNWYLMIDLFGPLGEALGDNALKVKAAKFTMDGEPATLTPLPYWSTMYQIKETKKPYKLVVEDEYQVAGLTGHVTQTSTYDTRVTTAPPSLSVMRVETIGGVATSSIPAVGGARLRFAGRRTTMDDAQSGVVHHEEINTAATRVWWRRSGGTDWLPLPVTMTGSDYSFAREIPGSVGTMYVADLSPASITSGAVDLKISLESNEGAVTEAVYAPAFVVTDPVLRRRAAGH